MGVDLFHSVYRNKTVLITGDTGFKGAWLSWWMQSLGAKVIGIGLEPTSSRSLFEDSSLDKSIVHHYLDIRQPEELYERVAADKPDFIFHLAAQSLVRESYVEPRATMETNVMGTANLLDAVRRVNHPCTVIVVTSDKCYENREWNAAYRETDAMGGHDPYSASKGATEIVASSYRRSFFPADKIGEHGIGVATVRAGNVIGPWDWALDRIVPDTIGSLFRGEEIFVRNPVAVRPWQHVLEPLSGYLWVAAKLSETGNAKFADAWNFGPTVTSTRSVQELVEALIEANGSGSWRTDRDPNAPHEATLLSLAIDKAFSQLGWRPVWEFEDTVRRTMIGYRDLNDALGNADNMRDIVQREIDGYTEGAKLKQIPWALPKS